MNGLLVRVGIDSTPESGRWNAPVDLSTREFVYVPKRELPKDVGRLRPGYRRRYEEVEPALRRMGVGLPRRLREQWMHLDPDFEHLTYGDKHSKAEVIRKLGDGDIIVFYAGMSPVAPARDPLVYALIGLYFVREIVAATSVPRDLWHENAHTRREPGEEEIIVRAQEGRSGRFERCIPVGERRDGAYRVTRPLLTEWGGLSVNDGWIQRSAVPPSLNDPERFLRWLDEQNVHLLKANNP